MRGTTSGTSTGVSAYINEDLAEEVSRHPESPWKPTKFSIEPQGGVYIIWLAVVVVVLVYNCVTVPYRIFFMFDSHDMTAWMAVCDGAGDLINLADLVLVRTRLSFISEVHGCWSHALNTTLANYVKSGSFKWDLLAVLPLETLLTHLGPNHLYRINRIFKVSAYHDLLQRAAAAVAQPLVFRVLESLGYMLLLMHVHAGVYHWTSSQLGTAAASDSSSSSRNNWGVFSGSSSVYLNCLYFAVKTALSIGRNVKPSTVVQYVFMAVSWLSGVFVFASLLGQVHDNIELATKGQDEFRKTCDKILKLLVDKQVPESTRAKAKIWLNHTWKQNKSLDEQRMWRHLPEKLHTDLAVAVHWPIMARAAVLARCPEALRRQLCRHALPITFLPGDYVVVRGLRVTGLYIVSSGTLAATSGQQHGQHRTVEALLGVGSVFGGRCVDSAGNSFSVDTDIRCVGYCSVLFLNMKVILRLVEEYGDAAHHLRAILANTHQQEQQQQQQ